MATLRRFTGYLDGIGEGITLVSPDWTSRESSIQHAQSLAGEIATSNTTPPCTLCSIVLTHLLGQAGHEQRKSQG